MVPLPLTDGVGGQLQIGSRQGYVSKIARLRNALSVKHQSSVRIRIVASC